jgi:hypothetical protein
MNREIVQPGGAGVYPLQGDVTSTAGNSNVKVTGVQGVPVQNLTLSSGMEWQYNANTGSWQPLLLAVIQVNGITVSRDPYISVNVTKPVTVNGA